uniref:Uncharacterized protein n=1 Tax=Anguilla anguilla TaxID=7936 RepID=A0A0E9TM51_ANGAN
MSSGLRDKKLNCLAIMTIVMDKSMEFWENIL